MPTPFSFRAFTLKKSVSTSRDN